MLQMASILYLPFLTPLSQSVNLRSSLSKSPGGEKTAACDCGSRLVSACKTLKSQTIEPMQSEGKLEDVIVTVIDKDSRPELVSKSCREIHCRNS